MDIERIEKLVNIFNRANLSLLEVSDGGTKIKIGKSHPKQVLADPPPTQPLAHTKENSAASLDQEDFTTLDFNKIIEVRSPLVGVFYSAPEPGADPFVSIGAKVKKGDVLCIIETMKVMNEITSDHDGEVADICIKNGEVAEFGQVLFKIF